MSLRISKGGTEQKILKITVIFTGALILKVPQDIVALPSMSFFTSGMLISFLCRFPSQSPLKSFPTRPLWRDSSDVPRLIRWDDYEELPQQENVAPLKPAVMVRTTLRCCCSFWVCICSGCGVFPTVINH